MDRSFLVVGALGVAGACVVALALARPTTPAAAAARLQRFGATSPVPSWAARALDRSRRATAAGAAIGAAASVALALAWPALLRQPHGTLLGQLWLVPTTVAATAGARAATRHLADGHHGAPTIGPLGPIETAGAGAGPARPHPARPLSGPAPVALVDPRLRAVGVGLVAVTTALGAAALASDPPSTGSAAGSLVGAAVALAAIDVARAPRWPMRTATALALAVGADAAHRAVGAGIALAGASLTVGVRASTTGAAALIASTAVSLAALGAWWWTSARARWTPRPATDPGRPVP